MLWRDETPSNNNVFIDKLIDVFVRFYGISSKKVIMKQYMTVCV